MDETFRSALAPVLVGAMSGGGALKVFGGNIYYEPRVLRN